MTNTLGFGFTFEQLYERNGLVALDARFLKELKETDAELHNRLVAAREGERQKPTPPHPNPLPQWGRGNSNAPTPTLSPTGGEGSERKRAGEGDKKTLSPKEESQLIIDLAPHVEDFIARLFGIEKDLRSLAEQHNKLAPLYSCKRLFVQRRAAKSVKAEEAETFDGKKLEGELRAIISTPPPPHPDPLPQWGRGDSSAPTPTLSPTGGEGSERKRAGEGEQKGERITSFELVFARQVMGWLDSPQQHETELEIATRYAAWAVHTATGQKKHKDGILFKTPAKLDFANLVPLTSEPRDGINIKRLPKDEIHQRNGFALTDKGADLPHALDEAHYCIYCHNQGRDSCSKGLRNKEGNFRQSPTRVPLAGCPLEEHISELNKLKAEGAPLAALATAVINNPMCAGTGHRICNDCMKSCIYQKQQPVDIPQVETRTLKDILALPYGFEIYSLLTRWNPLNFARPVPRKESGRKVLVVGLGPAGYTLSHHLLNDGHVVVAIDGLKIEPLPPEICGKDENGAPCPFKPIKDIKELYENLDERLLAGFGGVAEYGITVRWDKNFLKIIRLLLERRNNFSMFGGVRFGGTISIEDAWNYGFDHIALCMGAGKPTVIDMPNAMARGVRTASDFLMALQLTGAAKKDSVANLQLRLPVVVIGGGLTAIDAATESLAYYPLQVEKFLARYEALVRELGEQQVHARWSAEEQEIAAEFIAHARAIRAEREAAAAENREADIWSLLDSWGGVKLVYRRRLIDAPCYRLNHEEVEKAFAEGIFFAEQFEPAGVELDEYGHARAIKLRATGDDEEAEAGSKTTEITLPARTIIIAAGTSPNTVLQREYPQQVKLHGKYFQAVDEGGNLVEPEWSSKPEFPYILMSLENDGRAISFFGDLHPSFAGNVVKAMASAKQGYPVINRILARIDTGDEGEEQKTTPPHPNPLPQRGRGNSNAPTTTLSPTGGEGSERKRAGEGEATGFLSNISRELRATVYQVNRLTPNIVEVVINAPAAARKFQPGQFYRLQNYEVNALSTSHLALNTTLAMEGLAMTGAWVDKEAGLISVIALEMGGSSDLCAYLKPGEAVVLMGPTGTPTHIPRGETVMLVGGGLGNAVLFSIGKAMREAGCKVLYFAGYKRIQDRYKVEEIEAAADIVVWCCDEAAFSPNSNRQQDKSFHGNIVEAMLAYQQGKLGDIPIDLNEVDRIIAIGSDRMMQAVAQARHDQLKPYLKPDHIAIGSINSPMQCMMKEICAQCLQKHVDPKTGEESYIFSCFNQDQLLDHVSFPHLHERLLQNGVQEKLTALWIDSCLRQIGLRKSTA